MRKDRTSIDVWTEIMQESDSGFFLAMGRRIASRRKALRMTQAELGELLSVTQQQVASYERGERRIPVSRIPRLAECLSVEVDELISGKAANAGKRGPTPMIQRQLEQIRQLPRAEQQFVMKMLDNALAHAR